MDRLRIFSYSFLSMDFGGTKNPQDDKNLTKSLPIVKLCEKYMYDDGDGGGDDDEDDDDDDDGSDNDKKAREQQNMFDIETKTRMNIIRIPVTTVITDFEVERFL